MRTPAKQLNVDAVRKAMHGTYLPQKEPLGIMPTKIFVTGEAVELLGGSEKAKEIIEEITKEKVSSEVFDTNPSYLIEGSITTLPVMPFTKSAKVKKAKEVKPVAAKKKAVTKKKATKKMPC